MSCSLMRVCGLAADCTKEHCVYWAKAHVVDSPLDDSCMLDSFQLLGARPDRLTYWLLALKFKDESRPQVLQV